MTGYTDSAFERKLAELNSSAASIQSVSMWLIHHRKHFQSIVRLWYKEFLKAQDHRKLTFLYLANDVIQNSRKKGGEYGKAFGPILKKTLEYMARVQGEKVKASVLRILQVWCDRSIYDPNLVKDFEQSYRKAWEDLHGADFDPIESIIMSTTGNSSDAQQNLEKSKEHGIKRNSHESSTGGGNNSSDLHENKKSIDSKSRHHHHNKRHSTGLAGETTTEIPTKRHRTKREELDSALRKRSLEATNTIDEWEVDGVTQIEVKLSPSPYKEPPTEDELIQMTKDLEKMPSTDAVTRGKIANLPPEVSDVAGVDALCIDSDVSRALQKKVKEAADLLNTYNNKLDNELDERKKASMKVQDFLFSQKDLLTQAEHRLEEHSNHSKILGKKLDELKAHVMSMPDFTKMPSLTDGLQPLPSAGDLFQNVG